MRRSRFVRGLVASGLTSIALLAIGAGPAAAAGATVVSGSQSAPVASCGGQTSLGTFVMSGDLIGCWYTDTADVRSSSSGGTAVFSGTEHFVGCIDANHNSACGTGDPTGTWHTTFTFSAKFDAAGHEIHGRCHHPIVSGTGGFAHASGVISFHDIVNGTVVTSRYSGPVSL
jgi:hypothetical protein